MPASEAIYAREPPTDVAVCRSDHSFALTILRKEVLRDWGFLLVAMVLFGWVYQLTDDEVGILSVRSVHVAFGILFALTWIALGYALWSTRNMGSRTAKRSFKDPTTPPPTSFTL